ncbi:MAG: hypothetical protein ACF8R7_03370 [Phycisphaerales bacterium JB039]
MPKSGGTTLEGIVRRQYPGGKLYRFTGETRNFAAFRALPEGERASYDLLSGHMYFGMHGWVPEPATYMTMLREPVDRVVSFYYYVKRRPDHYMWNFGFTESMTLRQFLEQGRCIELDNFQTRNLGPEPRRYLGFGLVSDYMRGLALAHLEQMAAVGLTDRFDESLEILRHRFGWQDLAYERMNVTRDRPSLDDIDPATLDLIRQINRHDIAIYRRACQIFEAQLEEARAPACEPLDGPCVATIRSPDQTPTARGRDHALHPACHPVRTGPERLPA